MRVIRALVLCLASACADPGDPPDGDALVNVVEEGGVVQVNTSVFTMEFAPTGVKMPTSLRLNGKSAELLATNDCNLEGRVGLAAFPAVSVIAGDQGDAQRSEIRVLMDGPVIAQVKVTYEVDYACAATQTFSGETTFTFFPTGRLVRQDHAITPSTTTLADGAMPCGCEATGGNYFFTSFWAFDPTGLIDVAGQPGNVDENGTPVTAGVDKACSIYDDHGIAVSWAGGGFAGTRIGVNGVASHVLDLIPGGQSQLAPDTVQDVFSAIQVEPDDPGGAGACANMLARLGDGRLDVGGVTLDSTGPDGIYRDPNVHDTPFDITAPDGDVPAGFVVSIDLDGSSHAELTRDPPTDRVAFVQRDPDDDNRFFFAFPLGLASGERITITPISD